MRRSREPPSPTIVPRTGADCAACPRVGHCVSCRPHCHYARKTSRLSKPQLVRLMLRVKYNPAYPYNIVMMRHAPFIATERSVAAHQSRPDGHALSEGTGYQANLRYGSQQSVTRNWHMPMHQLDTLFHKQKTSMTFIFGGEADNHAINTVPKETLVRVVKAEDGGLGGTGIREPATRGMTPDAENEFMKKYLAGECVRTT